MNVSADTFSIFTPDYYFGPAKEMYDNPAKFRQASDLVSRISRQGMMELSLVVHHVGRGCTLNVEKRVTDDLMLTDLKDCKFEEMSWPARSIEFHFEDTRIGSMLIAFMDRATYAKELSEDIQQPVVVNDNASRHEYLMVASAQNKKHECCLCLYTEFQWREALRTGRAGQMAHHSPADSNMDPEESFAHHQLVILCMKVLAYASVPQLRPVPVQPHQLCRRKHDAKPGFKGRPSRPAFRVLYLPTIIRQTPKETTASGSHRTFKGRRGHLRYFRSDRFTVKKGTWRFIPPVAAPVAETPHTVFKVRKISA